MLNMSLKLNRSQIFAKIINPITAMLPPTTAEKNVPIKYSKMFETRCPKMLQGAMIIEYLKESGRMFMFNFGITFLIFLMFKRVIILMEIKKQTITLLILIIGVKTITPTIKTDDPIM